MTILKKASEWSLVAAFLGLFLFQAGYFALSSSTISDEVAHLGAGYTYVKLGKFELNLEHPPLVKEIAAAPLLFMNLKFPFETSSWENKEQWGIGRLFLYTMGNPAETMIRSARLALFVLPIFLGMLLYLFCRAKWGTEAGFFALFLYAFTPEFIAHSLLVTTDFAAAAFFFSVFYFLEKFRAQPTLRNLTAVGLCTGFAFASKYSMLQLVPLLYFAAVLYAAESSRPVPPLPKTALVFLSILAVSHKFAVMILLPPVLLGWFAVFFPEKTTFKRFRVAAAAHFLLWVFFFAFLILVTLYFEPDAWFRKISINLLKKFFRGWTIFRDHAIGDSHPSFLFGEYSRKGWWYYYPVALFFKIPISIQILSLLGAVKFFSERKITPGQIYFYAPPAAYLFIACFINNVNIGVRHVLPLYPYIVILAVQGGVWLRQRRFFFPRVVLPGILGLWLVAGTISQFPNYLSYFNEFEGLFGKRENILGDSNISWGQDILRLRDYVLKRGITELGCIFQFNTPDEIRYYGIPYKDGSPPLKERRPGVYAIDIFSYQSLIRESPDFFWLAHEKPVARVGGSIFIFEIDSK